MSAAQRAPDRSKARRRALEILHAAEVGGEPADAAPSDTEAYAVMLVSGVSDHRPQIDALITEAAENWALDRMPFVDRNVLRIATFELLHTGVPTGVVVDEAVKLAKMLSTEGSGRFINGVLGRIARSR